MSLVAILETRYGAGHDAGSVASEYPRWCRGGGYPGWAGWVQAWVWEGGYQVCVPGRATLAVPKPGHPSCALVQPSLA